MLENGAGSLAQIINNKQAIVINSDNCNDNLNPINVFETLQHEMIHADIQRRLLEEYGLVQDPYCSDPYLDAFNLLINAEYGSNPTADEHELMINEYIGPMVQSLIEANGGEGSIEDFIGIVLNGLPGSLLVRAGYTTQDILDKIYHSFQYVSNPENIINNEFYNCP